MTNFELESKIRNSIEKVGEKFNENPHILLTEGDTIFYVLNELSKIPELIELDNAEKGGKTNKMHCFIPFFDKDKKKLGPRPDIVIIDVKGTDLTKGPTIHYSTKNYSVERAEFLIELKLNKVYGKSLTLQKIEEDINKLNVLCQRNSCHSIFVLFDKKKLFQPEELSHFNSGRVRVLYF